MRVIILMAFLFILTSLTFAQDFEIFHKDLIVAEGKMPNMTADKRNNIHVVYGTGDSIMYVSSKNGRNFTSPALIAILPNLFASAMRGPQIAVSDNGIIVTACTNTGNIFSYTKTASGKWTKATKVNDMNESAKEALMALSADGKNSYAVWLGVKSPKDKMCMALNQLMGASPGVKML